MIVYGVTNEDKGIDLFDGSIEECKGFLKDKDLTKQFVFDIINRPKNFILEENHQ